MLKVTRASQKMNRTLKILCVNIQESRTKNIIKELARRNVQVKEVWTPNLKTAFGDCFMFLRAVKDSDFVIFGVPVVAAVPWIWAAKLMRRPSVMDCPMDVAEWPFVTAWHWKWVIRFILRSANWVLTLKSRDYMIAKFGLRRDRVLFLENCPDPYAIESSRGAVPRFQRVAEEVVLCCSGCHPAHRLERFMPIFHELVGTVSNVQLLLIGDSRQTSIINCLKYAAQVGLGERVHVMPVISPVEDFYATVAQSDIWVATMADDNIQGRHELRMELLEVGLLGKPVVAARIPGLVENGLEDGKHLIFVDPGDAKESARKLAELIRNPVQLQQMGDNLRSCVGQRFSLAAAVDVLLEAVLGRPRASHQTLKEERLFNDL